MELPHLGQHCNESSCKQLDFLPVKCDACHKIFCKDHTFYSQHGCEAAYKKDVQVPVCPLCNSPVPVKRGERPDERVSEHIDRDCQSDPAKNKRRIYTNKCSRRGCKQREMIDITCSSCRHKYCLKHRHPQDHNCDEMKNANGAIVSRSGAAALSRFEDRRRTVSSSTNSRSNDASARSVIKNVSTFQGSLGEDEALARALQMSLVDKNESKTTISQREQDEEEDRQLAEALARSEIEQRNTQSQRSATHQQVSKDRCTLS